MFAIPMTVPVAAVDEDDRLALREDDIRTTGELLVSRSVNGETEAPPMEHRAKQEFRLGVLARDAGHHPASFLFVKDVRHSVTS